MMPSPVQPRAAPRAALTRRPGPPRAALIALGALALLMLAPAASACETEVARFLDEGELPAPTGISPNKDDSIRETNRISLIGQETARYELWTVMMGAEKTEAEIRDTIDAAMIAEGSNPDWPSFGTIVAAADNAAIPHGDPENHGAGPRIIRPGDVVVVDLGARVNDWVSDITRTYVLGEPNETVAAAYMAVYDAQNVTFPLITAGTMAWQPDAVARGLIAERGFGEYFIHSLGHGFGVCVHEPPLLSSSRDDPLFGLDYNVQPLSPTDAVTVEPGIYIPEMSFGIRIEDDFLVNTNGHEYLSANIPRDFDSFTIDYDDYPLEDGMTDPRTLSASSDDDSTLPFGASPAVMLAIMLLAAVLGRQAGKQLRDDDE